MAVSALHQEHDVKAGKSELLFGLPGMSQETGLIRAGFGVRQQWETKDCGWGGLEMNSSCLLGLTVKHACFVPITCFQIKALVL